MTPSAFFVFVAVRLLLVFVNNASAAPVQADSAPHIQSPIGKRSSSSYWVNNIERQGTVAFGDSSYQIYRNVMDFGAVGDGTTDDTAAINSAISSGNRCGQGCDSSTLTPALVYFPPGTYLVSSPIIQYYFTQFVGDAVNIPTIKAAAGFQGIAVIDADPYVDGGANWYTNQNNFYRQIRNFVIDLTAMPASSGSGIHWQVAQATSLQNIVFNMVAGSDSKQQGIFMDNGSGGFMSDLTFNGGLYGAYFGNQQFTIRNLTFNNCQTAIYMNWNWVFLLKSITVNDCGVALDMSSVNGAGDQNVGSVVFQDSTINNTPVGVITAFATSTSPNGTLVLDNVNFASCATAVQSTDGTSILAGDTVVASWAQGRKYFGTSGSTVQGTQNPPAKPAALLDASGAFFERSKPQYESYPASSFVSVKSAGAKGDGVTDDTAAIQAAMNAITSSQILYFDHGAYLVSSTIHVPSTIKITGEIWPIILAAGSAFSSQTSPTPVFQIGAAGDTGAVEISDLVFQTRGPQPGAIMLQWNVAGTSQGATAMWDTHMRIGGSAGTDLQADTCIRDPGQTSINTACIAAFLLLHVTPSASLYAENAWLWVADHELDQAPHNQTSIYNGRGALVESTVATWLYGTAAEHSTLYNYEVAGAHNVYMGVIQSETPYFQATPNAFTPFTSQPAWHDPTFAQCSAGDATCYKAWGLKIWDSRDVLVYGAGLYSFFDDYDQDCLDTGSCQRWMVMVQTSQRPVLWGVSTVGAVDMIGYDGVVQAVGADNRNWFCDTVAFWDR